MKGFRRARACRGRWTEEYAHYTSPEGKPFYVLTGKYENHEPEATDTDRWALAHNYVAVTPTQLDVTARELVDVLREVL